LSIQTNPLGNPVITPSGNTITTTAANAIQSSVTTSANIALGTANVVVGGIAGAAVGVAGSVVGAAVAPVINTARQVNQVIELIQNPSLGGALALLGRGFPPFQNELDQFASYSYIFTLSCLTNLELNFPLSYRTVGPLIQVIRSGGTGGKKIPTIYETDGIVEFFIDDVNIDAVIAPNRKTGHSNAVLLNFKVIEPYSMGQFLQNLRTAALVAGHLNYIEAPFLLSVEFIGYDDQGNIKAPFFSKRHIPIKIIKADMNVTEAGAVYEVEAVPYNEIALTNANREAKTDVDIRGTTVGELLQSGPNSLTSVLNETMIQLQQANQVNVADQYVISFPKGDFISSAIGGVSSATSAVTTLSGTRAQIYEAFTGVKGGTIPPELEKKLQETKGVSVTRSALGEAVRAEANLQSGWNDIGSAKIVKNFLDGGKMPFAEPSFVEMPDNRGQINRAAMQTSDENRKFTFKSGTTIEEMIEEVILSSDYARKFVDKPADLKGKVTWFRIETHVYNVTDWTTVGQTGRSPRIYVYRVIPYKVDSSKVEGPKPNMLKSLVKQSSALKAYNYIYTGQNKDIINFDLNFDMSFFTNVSTTRGQMQADSKKPGGQAASTPDASYKSPAPLLPAPAPAEGSGGVSNSTGPKTGKKGGGGKEHVENSIARMFNDAILNSDADLINVKLTIHGDPYFIVDAGIGNYLGIENPLNQAITLEGSLNPRKGEVDVILNFRTPIDYDGEDGFVKYPLGGFLPIGMFSGVYQVILVTNKFSKGQFTQELDLVRKKGQDLTLEGLASAAVDLFNDARTYVTGTKLNQIDEKDANAGPP
jgi:hypothetical protein